ncbi:MAG: SMC family ATPase [Candidatus Diapherotrites archaeon]
MIKKIVLENWKTHKNSEFEFGSGTNVLVGPMGAGKSAVMDAISFALFGTFPAANAKRVSLDETIMAKPVAMDNAKIVLEFDYDGKSYSVERSIIKGGTNSGKLYREGILIAGPKTKEVTNSIESLLEINYDLFSRAVYSEQNQLDFFLRLSPAQRKDKFDDLLNLNRYEKVRSNSVTVSNRLKDISKERKKMLEQSRQELKDENVNEIEKRLSEKKKHNLELEKKIDLFGKDEKEISEKISNLEKKALEFKESEELRVRLSAKTEQMKKTLEENMKKIGNKTKEMLEKEVKEISGKKEKSNKAIETNEKTLDGLQKHISEISEKDAVYKSGNEKLGKQLKQFKELDADCPLCKTALSNEKKEKLIKDAEKEIAGNLKEISKLDKKHTDLKKEFEQHKHEIKSLKEITDSLVKEEIKINDLVLFATDVEKNKNEISVLENELEKVKVKIKHLGFDEKLLSSEKETFSEIKSNKLSAEKEISGNIEMISELEKSIERIEKETQRMEELEKSILGIDKNIDKLSIFTNSLKAVQAEMRDLLIENINNAMSDIWPRIYPYGDYTNAKMEIEDGNYELKVLQREGAWVRVEGILSGGERSSAALCIRIAFSLVLTQNLSWLILDEPTHNLDSEAIRELSVMLREHLPEVVGQIFVITHDKEMENAASSNIYVLHRDKNNDGVTKPEFIEIRT